MRVKVIKEIGKGCCICDEPVHHYNAKYCLRCAKFGQRMKNKSFPAETVKAIWEYIRRFGYVCYYTGMALDLENRKSPLHLVFDHYIPGDPSKIVITSAWLNDMKSDMSEDEFKDSVCQLADYFRKGTPIVLKPFVYWDRLYPI